MNGNAINPDEFANVVEKTLFSEAKATITTAAALTLEFFGEQGDYKAGAIGGAGTVTRIGNIKTPNKIVSGIFQLDRIQLVSTINPVTDAALDIFTDFSEFIRRGYLKIERGNEIVYDQPTSRLLKPQVLAYKAGATDTANQLVAVDGLTGQEIPLLQPIRFSQDHDFTVKIYGYWPNNRANAIVTMGINMIGQMMFGKR